MSATSLWLNPISQLRKARSRSTWRMSSGNWGASGNSMAMIGSPALGLLFLLDYLSNLHAGVIRDLGGSGTIDEIAERVITTLKVPEDVASQLHNPDNSNE